VPGDGNNNRFNIYRTTSWGSTGSQIATLNAAVTAGQSYYGRFYLVGSSIQGKIWLTSAPEPLWGCSLPQMCVSATDSTVASGNHYGQVDGTNVSMDHRHRTMIIRPRVASEPTLTLGAEASGARADALTPLAGPFRSLTVACFNAAGASISCSSGSPPSTAAVKAVQVTLVVMDSSGSVPDLTLTGEALRRSP